MKKRLTTQLVALLTLLVATSTMFVGCNNDDDETDNSQKNIVELAQSTPSLSTLASAIDAAGLTSTLSGTGPFTVFAPTNDAFNALPAGVLDSLISHPDQLADILKYHVVSGSVTSSSLSSGPVSTLLSGESIDVVVSGGTVTLNGSSDVTMPDVMASNGVVHLIDEVLLPPTEEKQSILEIASASDDFSTLVSALNKFPDLITTLTGDGPFTVFAPTNEAFEKFISEDNRFASLDDIDDATLKEVLKYHVIANQKILSSQIASGDVATYQGEDVAITKDANGVMLNDNAKVTMADIDAKNGVIHVVDDVILPPSLQQKTIAGIAVETPDLSTLVSILSLPELSDLLSVASNKSADLTVFAPTNAAFADLLTALGKTSLDEIPTGILKEIVEYHILGSAAFSEDLMAQTYPTLLPDESVTVSLMGGVKIDDANVVTADVHAANGVVHVIDKVLLPSYVKAALGTIVEVAMFNKDFTTLTAAVRKAGLLNTLETTDNLTLFAPNNAAFEAKGITSLDDLTAEDLTPILLYHVVGSKVMSSDLASIPNGIVNTLNTGGYGKFFLSLGSDVYINGSSRVIATDIEKSNGVVHVIDKALIPPSKTVVEIASALATADNDKQFTKLVGLLTDPAQSDVLSALSDANGNFTVFAPTDAAFDAIASTTAGLTDAQITKVLKYHVLNGRVFSTDLSNGLMPATLEGEKLTINISGDGAVSISDAGSTTESNVIQTNILGTNGVIHVIDKVLIPSL